MSQNRQEVIQNLQDLIEKTGTLSTNEALVLKELEKDLALWLKENNLKAKKGKCSYNIVENCQVLTLDVEDAGIQNLHSNKLPKISGRKIRIKVFNENSTTQHTGRDYQNRLQVLKDSAIDFLQKVLKDKDRAAFIRAIDDINKYYQTYYGNLGNLDPHNPEDHAKALAYLQGFNSIVADKLQSFSKDHSSYLLTKLGRTGLGYIDNITYKNTKKNLPKEPKDWLKVLELHEARFTALKTRDVLVNISKNSNSENAYTVNTSIPYSDVPSTLRTGTGNVLPNWYRSITKCYRVENHKATTLHTFNAERSSSFTPIQVSNAERREKIAQKIAENKLKTLVREKILKILVEKGTVSANDLEDSFKPQMMVMTLLTLNNITGAFTENEMLQFEESKKAFENIRKQGLKLQKDDIDYIKSRLQNEAHVKALSSISNELANKKIEAKVIYKNFAANDSRFISLEGEINKEASKEFEEWIKEYFGAEIAYHSDPKKNIEVLKGAYKGYEVLYDNALNETTRNNLKEKMDILSLYIKYKELLSFKLIDTEHNYMQALFTALLANKLGKEIHITCKSGEDRTGAMFVAIECALACLERLNSEGSPLKIHHDNEFKLFMEDFWLNFNRAELLSNSRDITNANAIGARGLQSLGSTMVLQESVSKELVVSNHMAKTAKGAFSTYRPMQALVNIAPLAHSTKVDLAQKRKRNKIESGAKRNDEASLPKDKKMQVEPLLQSRTILSDPEKSYKNVKNSVIHKVTQEVEDIMFHEKHNCFMLGDSERVRVNFKQDELRLQAIGAKLLPIDLEIMIKAIQASNEKQFLIEGGKLKDAVTLYEKMVELNMEPILSPAHLTAINEGINKPFKARFEKASAFLESPNKDVVLTKKRKPQVE